MLPQPIGDLLKGGCAIPAHPLALNRERRLDERRQRALSRYYLDVGVGGLAVGVHTTQFEIRNPEIGLYEPVLTLAKEEFDSFEGTSNRAVARIAGVVGRTRQATAEDNIGFLLFFTAPLFALGPFSCLIPTTGR